MRKGDCPASCLTIRGHTSASGARLTGAPVYCLGGTIVTGRVSGPTSPWRRRRTARGT